METNVNMVRKMGGFDVIQRTKDSMFNATALLKQWNNESGQQKQMVHFTDNDSTKELIEAILDSENFKERKSVVYQKRGKNGGTWMHPYLFIDFAMWINPRFKLQVIKFVYDQLIKYRHDAGDNYRLLSASGVKLKGYNFAEIATAMNWIIFNKRGKNLRQTATQEELEELSGLEKKLSFAIDMGYIKSYDQLLQEMRRIYAQRLGICVVRLTTKF